MWFDGEKFYKESTLIILKGNENKSLILSKALEKILSSAGKDVLNIFLNDCPLGDKKYDFIIAGDTSGAVKAANSILLLTDSISFNLTDAETYNSFVIPYKMACDPAFKDINDKNSIFTFSANDDNANLVAKNIKKTDDKICFELLETSSIGRVKFCSDMDLEVEDVLALSAVLLMADISFAEVISKINSF